MKGNEVRVTLVSLVAAMAACVAVAQDTAAKTAAPAKDAKTAEKAKAYKPIAEARAQIGDVISDPAKMVEIMKGLSPEDQKTFLADVNAAIAKLPGSVEDKTAKYLNVNRAALKGAATGNMANVLAVTFATVPPESLTVISERYANDLFNRDADPSHKFTDAAYEKTASEVIGKVVKETTGSDDAGVRNTLAVIMFLKADNAATEGLADRLVAVIPDSTTREMAKKEWIPQSMAEGEEKSYDGMLAYADAGKAPDLNIVLDLAGPQMLDAVLIDITSGMENAYGYQTTPVLDQAFGGYDEPRTLMGEMRTDTTGITASMNGGGDVPRTTAEVPWNPDYKRGDSDLPKPPEPSPYPFVTF